MLDHARHFIRWIVDENLGLLYLLWHTTLGSCQKDNRTTPAKCASSQSNLSSLFAGFLCFSFIPNIANQCHLLQGTSTQQTVSNFPLMAFKMETQNQEKKTAPLVVKTSCYWSHPNCLSRFFTQERKKRSGQNTQTTPKTACLMDCWWWYIQSYNILYHIYIYINVKYHILIYLVIFHASFFRVEFAKRWPQGRRLRTLQFSEREATKSRSKARKNIIFLSRSAVHLTELIKVTTRVLRADP